MLTWTLKTSYQKPPESRPIFRSPPLRPSKPANRGALELRRSESELERVGCHRRAESYIRCVQSQRTGSGAAGCEQQGSCVQPHSLKGRGCERRWGLQDCQVHRMVIGRVSSSGWVRSCTKLSNDLPYLQHIATRNATSVATSGIP